MLNVYGAANGCLTEFPASETDLPADAVWIDLVEPTANEESKVEAVLGIDIPTREELAEIEAESMGWTPLEPGVYLHLSDGNAAEVLVVGMPQTGAAVLLVY